MYINKSLSYLEQVVVALTTKSRAHVPYRQTKLTHVLKDALGGNCRTLFLACAWCESRHMEETISTLRLASRMMRVRNEASVREDCCGSGEGRAGREAARVRTKRSVSRKANVSAFVGC